MHSTTFIWALVTFISNGLAEEAPGPLVIPASEYFEGNDGPWSTFNIRVGTPEQDIRVLISTASPQSMVPLAELGCSAAAFNEVPPDCAVSRGNLFDYNVSSTWINMGDYAINQDGVGLEANLGYSQDARFGLEHVGIGLLGPDLENQTVAVFATAHPFYLGIFGLNNQPVNFTELGNHTSPSFLTTLKDQGKIPSLSWSYTAGAKYRLKQVYGQLIFSGYDTSRFRENSVSFTMAEDVTRDLVVVLQSISFSGKSSSTLLSEPIDIFIDSTEPNLWLPGDVCDAFEEAFGLTLDEQSGLYLVNDTHRNTLLDSDARVSLRLSDVRGGGETVAITIPYAALDLTAEKPLVDNTSHYFPLKRANDSTQYTLGRVFLQEAYLSADYERKLFNVSACVWDQGSEENIVTITPKDGGPGQDNGGGSSSSDGLGGGVIAGIVIGAVVGALLLAAIVTVLILRKRRKWLKAGFSAGLPKRTPDESIMDGPVFNSGSHFSPGDSVPVASSADLSGVPTISTAGGSRSGTDSLPRPMMIAQQGAGGSTPELDGEDTLVRPDTELDGHEVQLKSEQGVTQHPGVHELPATEARAGMNREISTVGDLPMFGTGKPGEGRDSQRSLSISTLGSVGGQDNRPVSDLVSPSTPTYRRQ